MMKIVIKCNNKIFLVIKMKILIINLIFNKIIKIKCAPYKIWF